MTESPIHTFDYYFSQRICQSCGTQGTHVFNYPDHGQMLCKRCESKCRTYLIDHFFGRDERENWNLSDPQSRYYKHGFLRYQKEYTSAVYHIAVRERLKHLVISVQHRCICGKLISLNYHRKVCENCSKLATKRCHRCMNYHVVSSEELGEDFDCCKLHYNPFDEPYCTGFFQREESLSHTCASCAENDDNKYYHYCAGCGTKLEGSLREVCIRKRNHNIHHLQFMLWKEIFAEIEAQKGIREYHAIKHYLRFHGLSNDIRRVILTRCNEKYGTEFPLDEQNDDLDFLLDFSGQEVKHVDNEDLLSLLVNS